MEELKKRRIKSYQINLIGDKIHFFVDYLSGDGKIISKSFVLPLFKKNNSNILIPQKKIIYDKKLYYNSNGEFMYVK